MSEIKPNLKVIDEAIERIECGLNTYSCMAILDGLSLTYPLSSDSFLFESDELYLNQYEKFTFKKFKGKPIWWNSGLLFKQERIENLKAFKQACIKAGKKANV